MEDYFETHDIDDLQEFSDNEAWLDSREEFEDEYCSACDDPMVYCECGYSAIECRDCALPLERCICDPLRGEFENQAEDRHLG